MGKKSTKENKNIYQLNRERLELTREKASELLESVTSDRIEKIESGKSLPHPDEVLAMAKCYQNPLLCNYFCSEECPIGRQYVPKVESKMLSQIVLEMLASLNSIDKKKNRLIEITADGEVSAAGGDLTLKVSVHSGRLRRPGMPGSPGRDKRGRDTHGFPAPLDSPTFP